MKSKNGFTLIEVMISMAILSMMSLLIYTSTFQTINGKQMSENKDEQNHSASLALGKMSYDLQMAFILGAELMPSDGRMKTVFIGQDSDINFPSFAHYRYFKNSPEADFGEIGYSIDTDKENSQKKVLLRRESATLDDKPSEGGVFEVLVEGVKEMHFEYYDPDKKEWLKSWDSSQLENSGKLPRAVKIQLILEGEEGEDDLVYQTIAELRMYKGALNF
ncbi:MAG: prepilin-type N-terminal cleavage/methylation domain-containing protein [Deltaproteobacteria bacterium]|nr:prepilin-type N-terminal cleavage/methylation domain-containing protein [Deltaproteobacteria bacterium]